jgi:tRNA(Ile)-lysidine synthase
MDAVARVVDVARAAVPSEPLLVALSGGADSAVAAWVCMEVAGAPHVRLIHVDHGLAGSPAMRAAAELVADVLGLPLLIEPVDIGDGGSEETRARVARLAALDAAVRPGEWIVTGHHGNDLAETVLANLLRGAGATGLSGIASPHGNSIRPLLSVPGDVVRCAADELRLPYRNDPANRDLRHRRNVIRHRVLPALEAETGLSLRATLERTGRLLSADDAYLDTRAADVPVRIDAGAALLPAGLIAMLPRPVASRAVRRAIRMVRPPYPGTAAEVAAVLDAAAGAGTRQMLDGWFAIREGPHVAIAPALDLSDAAQVELSVPGSIEFGHGHLIEASLVGDDQFRPRPIGPAFAVVDASGFDGPLAVRAPAAGERIDIAAGSKSVREALAEAGVPPRHRSTWPVVVHRGKIVWVAGVRVAASAQPDTATGSRLLLRWERTAE